ncbi:M20 family metallopeptidase [Singulisphaera sp. GP187]|uniref:M20 family metallopeptidase n=1 Tax=Singulisphaera sp. GP187 TaxID=1882752 RepID=UPI000940BA1A|nr:M20/M25/M40 family metallo-hydrolase [Singulisphaera sp. GP187]
MAIPSPTGQAGAVSDLLAGILREDGFVVERPEGGHPVAPAVAVRFSSGRPGRTLQFDGHLDTVHLPFVAPTVEDGLIRGSGASDMKGGVAAAIEAVRAIRDAGALSAGSILLTAHDLHEAPWGDGRQLDQLIRDGYVGDAVLIPEPMHEPLAVIGRGSATWKVSIRRDGPPVHEVRRPVDQPSVIAAGAALVAQLKTLNDRLSQPADPLCGSASVFIGQFHAGEIYNQFPQDCWLQGTRRWLPGTDCRAVESEFRALLAELARQTQTEIDCDWFLIRDAFRLDQADPFVTAFQSVYRERTGAPLTIGGKMFVDDGNSFWTLAQVPAITHGARSGGAHTIDEWVSIDDLVRVAEVYALTAAAYCPNPA